MKFLSDANIFNPMVEYLRNAGHDVFDLKEMQLENISDEDVFKLAIAKDRIIITMDKDFSNIIAFPPGSHPGIIVLKLYNMLVSEATDLFAQSFETLSEKDIFGHIVIIDKNKTRIRKRALS